MGSLAQGASSEQCCLAAPTGVWKCEWTLYCHNMGPMQSELRERAMCTHTSFFPCRASTGKLPWWEHIMSCVDRAPAAHGAMHQRLPRVLGCRDEESRPHPKGNGCSPSRRSLAVKTDQRSLESALNGFPHLGQPTTHPQLDGTQALDDGHALAGVPGLLCLCSLVFSSPMC